MARCGWDVPDGGWRIARAINAIEESYNEERAGSACQYEIDIVLAREGCMEGLRNLGVLGGKLV